MKLESIAKKLGDKYSKWKAEAPERERKKQENIKLKLERDKLNFEKKKLELERKEVIEERKVNLAERRAKLAEAEAKINKIHNSNKGKSGGVMGFLNNIQEPRSVFGNDDPFSIPNPFETQKHHSNNNRRKR